MIVVGGEVGGVDGDAGEGNDFDGVAAGAPI